MNELRKVVLTNFAYIRQNHSTFQHILTEMSCIKSPSFGKLPTVIYHQDYGNTGCGVFKRGIQLENFLYKYQHTQRKLLNFEFWINAEQSKIGHHFSNKVI